jgi:BlaI family transcriptional regulator, penicillinase repressor
MTKPPLTRREREIMDILHRLRRATAHEVRDNLADPPSYSAVRALLRLLEERGHIKHVEEGQRYVYSPSAAPSEARRSALSQVVRTFFGGSVEQAVAALVDTSKPRLSQDELDRIAQVIERARKEGR